MSAVAHECLAKIPRESDRGGSLGNWPRLLLDHVPGPEETLGFAAKVRQAVLGVGSPLRPLGDILDICRLGRFSVRERPLGGARGGLEAVLAPAPEDSFEIHVDPEPAGGWGNIPDAVRPILRRHRLRFRIAHEIAHSFFYARDEAVPHRRVGNSREQEEFCDRFAAEFLLPAAVVARVERSAPALVDLAARYDVSLQMAVRSFSAQWPAAMVALLLERAGSVERQWAAGDEHLPDGWWRSGDFDGFSAMERIEIEVFARSFGLEHSQVAVLPERCQVLLIGEPRPS